MSSPRYSAAEESNNSSRSSYFSSDSGILEDEDPMNLLPKLTPRYTPNLASNNRSNLGTFENYLADTDVRADSEKIHGLVVDFLICEGYREAAELLCAQSNIEFPEDEKVSLDKRYEIRTSIVKGEVDKAIQQINNYTPNLLKENPKIHFQLLRQQLVELIRNKNVEEALEFAQKHLVHMADQPPELLQKLEQTYGLLVFEKPESSPFGHLMEMNQRNILAAEVNSLICGSNGRNPTSKLEQLFRLIVWNKQQVASRGEAVSHPDNVAAGQIAKAMFCPEDALHRGIADF
uniref:Uncharacterized protein n=1 Tax=Panagrolaimus sp. PS1159 TaxID=55785 RepID=A0AC35G0C3_9BILA